MTVPLQEVTIKLLKPFIGKQIFSPHDATAASGARASSLPRLHEHTQTLYTQ